EMARTRSRRSRESLAGGVLAGGVVAAREFGSGAAVRGTRRGRVVGMRFLPVTGGQLGQLSTVLLRCWMVPLHQRACREGCVTIWGTGFHSARLWNPSHRCPSGEGDGVSIRARWENRLVESNWWRQILAHSMRPNG